MHIPICFSFVLVHIDLLELWFLFCVIALIKILWDGVPISLGIDSSWPSNFLSTAIFVISKPDICCFKSENIHIALKLLHYIFRLRVSFNSARNFKFSHVIILTHSTSLKDIHRLVLLLLLRQQLIYLFQRTFGLISSITHKWYCSCNEAYFSAQTRWAIEPSPSAAWPSILSSDNCWHAFPYLK